MYAITDELRIAWRALHEKLVPELKKIQGGEIAPLRFNTDNKTLSDPHLLIGQTCGYPLVTQYSELLTPVCVPHFNVSGCDGPNYSSAMIVSAQSTFQSLADCEGAVAVINSTDSNSGMNMLRAELASLRKSPASYFSQTRVSGSHLKSLHTVAHGKTDVAAIDCVTFAYIAAEFPELVNKVKILGYTRKTMGLPFVLPNHRLTDSNSASLTGVFNMALEALPTTFRERLRITKFSEVSFNDYRSISTINSDAIKAKHSALHL